MNIQILKSLVDDIVDNNSFNLEELLSFYHSSHKRGDIKISKGEYNHTEISTSGDDTLFDWDYKFENRKAHIYLVPDFENKELTHEVGHAILGLSMSTRDINHLGWYFCSIIDKTKKLDSGDSAALKLVDPRLEDIVHMLGMSDTYEWSGHDYIPEHFDEVMHEVFANWFSIMYDWNTGILDKVAKKNTREIIKSLDPNHEIWTILRHLCRIKIS